jgi:hypothetical protein
MHDGRSKSTWGHTSVILALIANVNRDPKKSDAFKPSDFDPHARKSASRPLPKVSMKSLKSTLMGLVPRNGKS